jgi:hypothetical protein
MRNVRGRQAAIARFTLLVAAVALAGALPAASQSIPTRLSSQEFWRLVTDLSETGGEFRSDNFVSNEVTYQYVIPDLVRGRSPGGVYLGVGPDQNFTYIVAMRPRIAFIVDIRRQAVMQHLMYKALMELSEDRAEFLSRLFSRPRPPGLSSKSTAEELFEAFYAVSEDTMAYWGNLKAIKDRLTKHHGFTLTPDDSSNIDYIYTSFYIAGPDITYNYGSGRGGFGRGMPTYSQLMVENDGNGLNRSYLASEQNYAALREMHLRNLIVPVVGDFAGSKALRGVGRYLKARGATVSAVYTSNVEQYLFQNVDNWKRYYENIGTLPIDSASTFVRAVFSGAGFRSASAYGPRSVTMLCSIETLLREFREGRLYSYQQVVAMSR